MKDADGTERWRVETTPLAPPVVDFAVATADAEQIYLFEKSNGGDPAFDIVARKRTDGAVIWRTAVTHGTKAPEGIPLQTFF